MTLDVGEPRDQISIARAAAVLPTSRAFLHWRLSDDGPGASRIVAMGRHPKPFTLPDSFGATMAPPRHLHFAVAVMPERNANRLAPATTGPGRDTAIPGKFL
jgi:hypothetical protein